MPGGGCLQTELFSGNHKANSAALLRLLTQTIKAPLKKNTVIVTKTQKEKEEKDDSE